MERNISTTLMGALLLLGLSGTAAQAQVPPAPAVPGQAATPPVGLTPPAPGQPATPPVGLAPPGAGQPVAPATDFTPFLPAGPATMVPGSRPSTPMPGGMMPGMGMSGMGMSMTPELGKKTMSVMALREMLALRLTARDLTAALPPLKDLRKSEKTLQSRSEQVLEEEKRALLAADAEGVLPLGSEEKLHVALQEYRSRQNDAWNTVARAIGMEKAEGLRRLVEGGPVMTGVPAGIEGRGSGLGIGRGSDLRPGVGRPRTGAPDVPATPGGPVPPRPDVAPDAGDSVEPPFGLAPSAAIEAGRQDELRKAAVEAGILAGNAPAPQGTPAPRTGRRPGSASPYARGGGVALTPFNSYYMLPRLTLSELIDLMEQKLAAMRH